MLTDLIGAAAQLHRTQHVPEAARARFINRRL